MCLYCYLVCNYNKCSYLRLFVNREQMMERLVNISRRSEAEKTFEIGSNSDLILENTITGNLEWTIPRFSGNGRGRGKYCYRPEARAEAEAFLRVEIKRTLGDVKILYIA